MVWYSRLKNFPQVFFFFFDIQSKALGVVNKAEVDIFLEFHCFFDNPMDDGNLILGSSAFSKSSLIVWNFTVHILWKPGLENF